MAHFRRSANWQDSKRPTENSQALFTLPNTYTVQFSADATNRELAVSNGTVSFDLQSHQYLVSREAVVDGASTSLNVNGSGILRVGSTLRLGNSSQISMGSGSIAVGDGGSFVAGTVQVRSAGKLTGDGTIHGDIAVSGGSVAPGQSQGTLFVDGNYSQQQEGTLEISVGGTAANIQHDLLDVSGSASVAGRLVLPIVDGLVPQSGNVFDLLAADSISGQFNSLVSPNLAAVNPDLAIKLNYSSDHIQAQFVAVSDENQLSSAQTTLSWADPTIWSGGAVPDTSNVLTLQNLAGAPQTIGVAGEHTFAHQIAVTGGDEALTVSIAANASLSATVGVSVADLGAIELHDGRLVSSTVEVHDGGILGGNGTVVGNVVVGAANSSQAATLSPGFSPGGLTVEGSYEQGAGGVLLIDVAGTAAGQFDTVAVSGQAELGGTLKFDASSLDSSAAGTTVEIFTAGSLNGNFDRVETVGSDEVYVRPIYDYGSGEGGGGSVSGGVCDLGDMNCDGQVNGDDTHAFAVALRNIDAYYEDFLVFTSSGGDLDGLSDGQFHPNGRIDFDDIDDFAALVSGSGSGASYSRVVAAILAQANVPEPSTAVLLNCWFGLLLATFRRRVRNLVDEGSQ